MFSFFKEKPPPLPSLSHIIWHSAMVAQTIKNLPVMWETPVQSLGCKDPLEKERATHSSILAWEIPQPEESDEVSKSQTQWSE